MQWRYNASPMMDTGNTATIMVLFLEGMREAGAEADIRHFNARHQVFPDGERQPCHRMNPQG
jgi:multimeric flavodoxin WrbA